MVVLVLDLSARSSEQQLEYVFAAVSFGVEVARSVVPFLIEVLLGGEIVENEVGVEADHDE